MMFATAPTAAGGVAATLQSAGFGPTGTATVAAVGSSIGAGVGIVTDTLLKC